MYAVLTTFPRNGLQQDEMIAAVTALLSSSEAVDPVQNLRELVNARLDHIPYPAQGQTLFRWQILAAVAAHDVSLAKLYEGHTDALAILAELHAAPADTGSLWGVWCAEPPDAQVRVERNVSGQLQLDGRKAWCSGAAALTHALISCRNDDNEPCLVAVTLRQPGVRITRQGWHAVGMQATCSVDIELNAAHGEMIGNPGDYLKRAGFWHGGAGIAACWYGATCAIGSRLHEQLHRDVPQTGNDAKIDVQRMAQLGGIDITLSAAAALLRDAAATIDRHPQQDAMQLALQCRLAVEDAATRVISLATRALGAAPLCREAKFARMVADLPVFLRQSHAERDLASLGLCIARAADPAWTL